MAASNELSFCTRGKRYFDELNGILKTVEVDEVDVVICAKPEKDSDSFILNGNKLAVKSWCVKDLFCFAYKELATLKRKTEKFAKKANCIMELSKVVLLLHAEDYTVWNLRKQCVVVNEYFRDRELDFCSLVLTKHPRSAESFSHRRWLINYILKDDQNGQKTPLDEELRVCLKCAERYNDNYTAWGQRCWLIDKFMINDQGRLLQELRDNEGWLWSHVSDYCGFHFRQHVLEKFEKLCSKEAVKVLLSKEFEITEELIRRYPGHETVWYHRRFLLNSWFSISPPCCNCLSLWQNNLKRTINHEVYEHHSSDDDRHTSEELRQCCRYCTLAGSTETPSLQSEMCFCQEFINVSKNYSPEQKRQASLSSSHLQWLKYFLAKIVGYNK